MKTQNKTGPEAKSLLSHFSILCAVLLVTACGTWAGNPKDPEPEPKPESIVALDIRGKMPSALALLGSIPVTGADGAAIGSLSLSKAEVVLSEIKLKTSVDDQNEGSREKFTGPYIVDLIANQTTPALDSIAIEAGIYSTIEMKLHKLEDGFEGAGSELKGNSLYLAGTYTSATGSAQTFTLSHEVDEEFNFSPSSSVATGISIADGLNSVLIAFDIAKWLDFSDSRTSKGVDFSSITGPIVLDKDNSSETAKKIREVIKENLKGSADFDKDDNKDGDLDKDEK